MSRSITSSDANGATFETVGSSGGFSAGELVYYGSTGYNRIPASAAPSTTSSTLTKSYPTLPTTGTSGGYFQSSDFPGLGYSRSLATLSNGNVVAVYANTQDGYPYFLVFNPTTRAIVTGPTVISTTFSMTPGNNTGGLNIGVAAFAGGNFVVYWGNNAGGTASRVNYATYTNAGAAVVAVTQDATLAVNNAQGGHMRGVTLPNGGFVLAFGDGTSIYMRAYNAAGVGQFAWVTLSGLFVNPSTSSNPSWGMTARSDNTYLIAGQLSGAYNYAIYNYAGTAVVAATTFALTGGTTSGKLDCATLSDGTTFVIAYAGQTATAQQGWSFRFLPTGNVLSSPFFLQGNFNGNTSTTATANYVRVWPLSSGRFLITGNDASNVGAYAVFNSSGTPLLGTTGSTGTASNTRSFGSYFVVSSQVLGVIEYDGVAEVYSHTRLGVNYPSPPYFRIDLTTYNMVPATAASAALTIPVGTTPITAYSPTLSTPSKASFALSNGVYPYAPRVSTTSSVTAAGVYPTITSVINSVFSYDMCVLSNGNIGVVVNGSGAATIVYVYNPITLALISSSDITAVAGASGSGAGNLQNSCVRITPLDGGSFCIGVATSSANLRLTAWTSGFVQQGSSVNLTVFTVSFGSQSKNFALTTISGNRVVVAYQTLTNSLSYAVYSSVLALVAGPTVVITDGSELRNNAVCASLDGFVVCTCTASTNEYVLTTYYEFTANTFTQPSFGRGTVVTGAPGAATPTFLTTNNNGQIYLPYNFDSSNNYLTSIYANTSILIVQQSTTLTSSGRVGAGITAAGTPFLLWSDATNLTTGAVVPGMAAVASITGWPAASGRGQTTQIRSVPLYGNMVLVAYLVDTNSALAFGTLQVNGYPDSAVFTTADTTVTSPIYPQPTTTTTPAVVGQTLAGVAVTDCAAGGTGVIQTTGATNLNSNYPTTTAQTFDYTGYAAPGIKGTISGRAISMRKS